MPRLSELSVGTKLSFLHQTYAGSGTAGDTGSQSDLVYAEVVKLGKVKVKVRDEFGNTAWKYPAFFCRVVAQTAWDEIFSERK